MDTIAMNTKYLEQEIIALAKLTGEFKNTIWECQGKLKKYENRDFLEEKADELLLMQEELWCYIQNLETVRKMYEEIGNELVSIVTSHS